MLCLGAMRFNGKICLSSRYRYNMMFGVLHILVSDRLTLLHEHVCSAHLHLVCTEQTGTHVQILMSCNRQMRSSTGCSARSEVHFYVVRRREGRRSTGGAGIWKDAGLTSPFEARWPRLMRNECPVPVESGLPFSLPSLVDGLID